MASAVAVVLGDRGSVRAVASWASSTGGSMGRGAVEEAGDSTERLTEAADMRGEGVMLKQPVTGSLLSLRRGFFGGIPELVVAHTPAWQVPKCCHFPGTLSTSGGTGAVDMAHDVGGCGRIPLRTLPFLQLDWGVAWNNLIRT